MCMHEAPCWELCVTEVVSVSWYIYVWVLAGFGICQMRDIKHFTCTCRRMTVKSFYTFYTIPTFILYHNQYLEIHSWPTSLYWHAGPSTTSNCTFCRTSIWLNYSEIFIRSKWPVPPISLIDKDIMAWCLPVSQLYLTTACHLGNLCSNRVRSWLQSQAAWPIELFVTNHRPQATQDAMKPSWVALIKI